MKRRKIIPVLFISSLMVTVISGCTNSQSVDNNISSSASSSETAGNSEFEKTYRLIYTNPLVGHEFMDTITAGAQDAAEELGNITVEVVGPTSYNEEEFIKAFDTAVASQPDGIIGYGISEDLCLKPFNECVDAGIPLITVDCDTPDSNRLAYIGTGQYEAGYKCGEEMIELTGGEATIAIITAALDSESLNTRIEGFMDAIAEEPGMSVVVTESGIEILEATEKASQILLAYPEVNAFFCPSQNPLLGVSTSLTEKNLIDEYTVVGFDTSDEIYAGIRSGAIDATTVQQPYEMGYKVVEMFYELFVNGNEPEEEINPVEVIMCTKENVDEFDV